MKTITLGLFFLVFSTLSAKAQASCSSTFDQNTPAALKQFITNYNPFWGTWRGTYKGEKVVGELYLDKQNRFNIRGSYKDTVLNDFKLRLCYRNNKLQAVVYGFTVNIDVISQRQLSANHFLIDGPVIVQR